MPAVLVLEDDPSVQATLCTVLTLAGFALEEQPVAEELNAPIFDKPQPFSVLIQHLTQQLQMRPAQAGLGN